jgi:hypothetical protein
MRSASDDNSVAWYEIAWPHQEEITDRNLVDCNILSGSVDEAVRDSRCCCLELAESVTRFSSCVVLERFAATLHEDNDETCKRLPENERENYCECGDKIHRKAARRNLARRIVDNGDSS